MSPATSAYWKPRVNSSSGHVVEEVFSQFLLGDGLVDIYVTLLGIPKPQPFISGITTSQINSHFHSVEMLQDWD